MSTTVTPDSFFSYGALSVNLPPLNPGLKPRHVRLRVTAQGEEGDGTDTCGSDTGVTGVRVDRLYLRFTLLSTGHADRYV